MPEITAELTVDGARQDVTGDVRTSENLVISHGRRNEGARADPSRLSLKLNNRHGKYSPRNPRSPLYGRIGRNTPMRVSVHAGESYLDLDGDPAGYASTPDTAALDATTTLDLRAEVTVDWKSTTSQALLGKWDPTGDQRSYVLRINNGEIVFSLSTDGTLAGQLSWFWTLPYLPRRCAVRATFDASTGTAAFYWAPSLDTAEWTQIGDTISMGTPYTIHSGTADLRIAPYDPDTTPQRNPFTGRAHRAEVYVGGALAAAPDFRDLDPGTTAWTDAAGLPWTVHGTAAVTDRKTLFEGEVSAWPARWDVSDADVWVPVQASGIRRRLGQGAKPLDSTLRRRVPSGDPRAYWPMEEEQDASAAYSPVEGVRPLTVSGLEFASDDSLAGALHLPKVSSAGGSISGAVPGAAAGGWHVEMAYYLPALPATEQPLIRARLAGAGGGVAYAEARVSTAGIRAAVYDTDDVLVASFLYTDPSVLGRFTGVWNRLQLYSAVVGSQTYVTVSWIDVSTGDWARSTTVYTGAAGRITGVSGTWGPDFSGLALGHLAAFDVGGTRSTVTTAGVTIYDGADDGFDGEQAHVRMARLCAEEGVPIQINAPEGTTVMGPQRAATLLELLDECADVDGGLLTDAREGLALAYRARSTFYNQPTALALDYEAGEVAPPLEPEEDDQRLRNDVTRTRPRGSAARAVLESGPLSVQPPPDGVGTYDESLDVNVASDDQLPDLAGWALHLGTVDEARYPTLHINLAARPQLIGAVVEMDLMDRLTIANPPPWLPPDTIDQLAEGCTQTIGRVTWDVDFHCAPARPWDVAVLDDEVLGRLDTDGSELADPADPGATTLYVRPTGDWPDWVTEPSEFPFDVRVGGEVVTATACTEAAATPMPAAATSDTVASTSAVAPSVDAPGPGLLICAWIPWDQLEAWTVPGTMTAQAQTTGVWSVLADATEALAASGATGTRTATRSVSTAWAAISVVATGTPVVAEHLEGLASDATNSHNPGPVELTIDASTEAGWWLLALHAWDNNASPTAGGPSGEGWVELASSPLAGGSTAYVTAWAKRAVGGAETVTFPQGDADDNHARLYVLSGVADLTAQAMTVVRAVNGVDLAHAAGTDVRLAQPMILSH
ncbi:hypothetical protein [Streptomyces sp. DH37]|uniref:hypothetical protein n=1 Tax=Streptomyces sp. DH37 TaxID=3040122 RepID=UPI002440F885|nr:hypothetical protein [Streptomyces sp. DH37]MDG9705539.1 hypothetical protein [Streptomyces sp. DH37]